MKKLSIPVFALAGILAVLAVVGVIAGAAEASRQPGGLTTPPAHSPPTATPTPSPPPTLTPVEFEEFVDSLCNNSHVWNVGAYQFETDRLRLDWEVDKYEGPYLGLRYQGYELTFRIERWAEHKMPAPKVYDPRPWDLVDDVTNEHTWEGPAEAGDWLYRVGPFSVTHQGQTMRCPGEPAWVETYVSIVVPPTAEELAKFAKNLCEGLEVIDLDGYGEWDETWLYWDTNAHDLAESEEFYELFPIYEEYGLNFRIQWRPKNSVTWRSDEQVYHDRFWWDGGFDWEGAAEPGKSVYRVAVSSINIGGETVPCKAPLQYTEIDVETPSEEERAEIQEDREVLIGEMGRCAREALTRNISEEALPVVGKYVELLIEEEVGSDYGQDANFDLASLTTMMCALGSDEGSSSWFLFTLFGFGY